LPDVCAYQIIDDEKRDVAEHCDRVAAFITGISEDEIFE